MSIERIVRAVAWWAVLGGLLGAAVAGHAGCPNGRCVVDTTADPVPSGGCVPPPGTCSLRGALEIAQKGDAIDFGIKGCSGVCTIKPVQSLPPLDKGSVVVDGLTQPGASAKSLRVEIDGAGLPKDGLDVVSGNNTVNGLIINNFKSGAGILITPSLHGPIEGPPPGWAPSTITHNWIGTDKTGAQRADNEIGIHVARSADSNTIAENLVSGNTGSGMLIQSDDNKIGKNRVGSDLAGAAALHNRDGIEVTGAHNKIEVENLVSGNTGSGVYIHGPAAQKNVVFGRNIIGMDASGTAPLANKVGVLIYEATDNTVNGDCVSGNSVDGVEIEGQFGGTTGRTPMIGNNLVVDNIIGPHCDRTVPKPGTSNQDGVHIDASSQNKVLGNTISSNNRWGVSIEDADGNKVANNRIGVNGDVGVEIAPGNYGANGNLIGPDNHVVANVVGVRVQERCTGNTITRNFMGQNKKQGILLVAGGLPGNEGIRPPFGLKATIAPAGGQLRFVTGAALDGAGNPCARCLVEMFVAHPDRTGAGQGADFLSLTRTTAAGAFTFAGSFAGSLITTTVTDTSGNTSQFSTNARVP